MNTCLLRTYHGQKIAKYGVQRYTQSTKKWSTSMGIKNIKYGPTCHHVKHPKPIPIHLKGKGRQFAPTVLFLRTKSPGRRVLVFGSSSAEPE